MRFPPFLRDEACTEAYEYFDQNIRPLERNSNGRIDETAYGLHNNDVDAFRHAYVSGVFTQEYGRRVADIFGQLNELISIASPSPDGPGERNMDLWNNAVGRKYGIQLGSRRELAEKIKAALENGELITSPNDQREYSADLTYRLNPALPVVVAKESETGRNEFFIDLVTKDVMDRENFVSAIRAGRYPGYHVSIIGGTATPVSNPDGSEVNNLA